MELIHPSPKQKQALDAVKKYKFVLYGGAMYGGKSYWIRWTLIALLVYYFRKYGKRGVTVGLFCEDYPALKDRHLGKVETEFPSWLGKLHSDHKAYGKCFILSSEYGGGVLAFRNLDDPSKYASAEFAAIAVDELTKNTLEKFTALRHRLRWAGITDTKFIAGTNPGSIGHLWVKRYWLDRVFPPEEQEADQFFYIPAKYSDNPYRDEGYEKTLASLPPKIAKAFRDGDWNTFEGQYFEEWNDKYNICDPFKIPEHWMKFIWMDYGYSAPACVHWAAIDERGVVYVYRELYVRMHGFTKLARKVMKMTPDDEKIERMIADPAIFAKTGHGGDEIPKSGAEEMFEATNGWLAFERGNNDRINGWGVMREYIKPQIIGEGKNAKMGAKLVYFKTCSSAIETTPTLVYDSVRVEDLDTKSEDHAADTDRYGLMDLMELFSKKEESDVEPGTTDEIFVNDIKAMKEEKEFEERERDVEWEEL